MKEIGIVRKLDSLGRIVVPVEMRKKLNIELHDSLEIYSEGDAIVLKKYEEQCVFCGRTDEVSRYKGKLICSACLKELSQNSL